MVDASAPAFAGPTFREAFRFWLKLGFISFGGPAGQIAIMQTELVDRRNWIDQRAFLRGLTFCTLLPGPEAQQLATYIGWRLHGTWGGIVAGGLFVLPGALLLLALSWAAAAGRDATIVNAIFYGLKPVVIAVVAHAVWRVGKRALKSWQAAVLAATAFAAIHFAGVDFPWIVLAAGIVGWLFGRKGASPFTVGGHGGLDDAAPPERVMPRGRYRVAILCTVFAVLWAVPVAAAVVVFGSPMGDVAELFTKAAFVTFGGAYAVLPYVADVAVNDYAWLSTSDMLNGLALAETTPGPLVLVLEYVGFFAGWNQPGPFAPLTTATAAAALTTYVTFLPSFLFILIGAPYVESLHDNRGVSSALGAITAAVVGVILNLAVFLAEGVLVPGGTHVDWLSVLIAVAAFGALVRFGLAIHWLVLIGAAIGLAAHYALP
jgi:chromate transporter